MNQFNSVDLINDFFFLSVKITIVCMMVLWLVKYSRSSSSKTLHIFCCFTLLSLLFLAFSSYVLPDISLHIVPSSMKASFSVPFFFVENNFLRTNYGLFAFFSVYFLGAFAVLSSRLYDIFQLMALRRRSNRVNDKNVLNVFHAACTEMSVGTIPELMQNDELPGPVTWGMRRPIILLPPTYGQWSKERLHRVFIHELAHIQRQDWLHSLWIRCVVAIFWFLPPVWALASQILWRAELACDETVVANKHCRLEYANDLKSIALDSQGTIYSAMSLIERSTVFLRINTLLDSSVYRGSWSKAKSCGYLLMACCLCFSLASLKLSAYAEALPESKLDVFPLHILDSTGLGHMNLETTLIIHEGNDFDHDYIDDFLPAYIKPHTHGANSYLLGVASNQSKKIYQRRLKTNLAAAIEKPQLNKIAKPHVSIEGYLPLVTVTPAYPKKAIRRKIEGEVIVQFDVLANGQVDRPRIIFSKPQKVFDKSVIRAVSRFKFKPKKINRSYVRVSNVTEKFVFRLTEEAQKSKSKPIRFNRATQFAKR